MDSPNQTRSVLGLSPERLALLRWCTGALLALSAYALVHIALAPQAGTLAELAQYAVPVGFLAYLAFCILRHRLGDRPNKSGAVARAPNRSLDKLDVDEFEVLLAEAFRQQGYQIVENTGGGAGGRVDMVLRRERQTFLVISKRWKEARIEVGAVQALQRIISARGADGGFVVTLGRFSRDATAFAGACNVRLVEGKVLRGMVERVRATRANP